MPCNSIQCHAMPCISRNKINKHFLLSASMWLFLLGATSSAKCWIMSKQTSGHVSWDIRACLNRHQGMSKQTSGHVSWDIRACLLRQQGMSPETSAKMMSNQVSGYVSWDIGGNKHHLNRHISGCLQRHQGMSPFCPCVGRPLWKWWHNGCAETTDIRTCLNRHQNMSQQTSGYVSTDIKTTHINNQPIKYTMKSSIHAIINQCNQQSNKQSIKHKNKRS